MTLTAKQLEQIRYDLASEVLALGKDAPIELETVLDTESDSGAKFATEAAAILAYDGEAASEYQFRVTNWLRGLIEKHIEDEQCEAYAEKLAEDAHTESLIEERREQKEAA